MQWHAATSCIILCLWAHGITRIFWQMAAGRSGTILIFHSVDIIGNFCSQAFISIKWGRRFIGQRLYSDFPCLYIYIYIYIYIHTHTHTHVQSRAVWWQSWCDFCCHFHHFLRVMLLRPFLMNCKVIWSLHNHFGHPRHCATSRKVAASIPDGVIGIFHWHDPSGRTMALG